MPLTSSLNRKEHHKAQWDNVLLMHGWSQIMGEKIFVTNYRSIFQWYSCMLVTGKHAWQPSIQSQWVRRQKCLYCISPKQPFHLTYSIDIEREWDIERERQRTTDSSLILSWSLYPHSSQAHLYSRGYYVWLSPHKQWEYKEVVTLQFICTEIKYFSCDCLICKTQREGEGERNRGFIATHPNISRQCVTKYAGPIYVSEHQCIPLTDRKCCFDSSAQPGIQRMSRT